MTALLTANELLAGGDVTYDVEIPSSVLAPAAASASDGLAGIGSRRVRLRPLTLRDVQLIAKAARDDDVLTSLLMIQRAVVDPPLKEKDVAGMRSGVVRFLVTEINRVSGLTSDVDTQRELAESPFMQALVILASEFGWTPDQMRSLTVAQVVGFLDGLQRLRRPAAS